MRGNTPEASADVTCPIVRNMAGQMSWLKAFCTTGRWLCLYPRRQDCCRVTESKCRLRWVAGMFTGVWGLVLGREFLLAGAWPRL